MKSSHTQGYSPSPVPPIKSTSSSGTFREPVTPSKGKPPGVHFRNFDSATKIFDNETPRPNAIATEIQSLRDEVSALHSLTLSLTGQNALLRTEHQETMEMLRSIQLSLARLTQEDDETDAAEDHQTREPAKQPQFNLRSRTFYTVLKGRCPGIYTDHDWVRFLIDGLGMHDCQWKAYPTYAEALEAFKTGMTRSVVALTGRSADDEHIYGPRSYFVPFQHLSQYQSFLETRGSRVQ